MEQPTKKTIQNWVGMITSNMALIAGVLSMVWNVYAKPSIEQICDDRINQWKNDSLKMYVHREIATKKHGFRMQVVEAFEKNNKIEIDPDDVAVLFSTTFRWTDSLQKFDRVLKPMLTREMETFDVGLKVNRKSNDVEYLHTDGRIYFPSYDTKVGKYYIVKNGKQIWCH